MLSLLSPDGVEPEVAGDADEDAAAVPDAVFNAAEVGFPAHDDTGGLFAAISCFN